MKPKRRGTAKNKRTSLRVTWEQRALVSEEQAYLQARADRRFITVEEATDSLFERIAPRTFTAPKQAPQAEPTAKPAASKKKRPYTYHPPITAAQKQAMRALREARCTLKLTAHLTGACSWSTVRVNTFGTYVPPGVPLIGLAEYSANPEKFAHLRKIAHDYDTQPDPAKPNPPDR
jgi:hypothetical protein